MNYNLDFIVYGNPNQNQLKSISKITDYDSIINLKDFQFPQNTSINTKIELNELVSFLNQKTNYNFNYINDNLENSIYSYFKNDYDEDYSEIIRLISQDVKDFIVKLKYHYNRPRPNQLAFYYSLALYPVEVAKKVNSPSYPCGDVLKSSLILKTISYLKSNREQECLQIQDIINNSKLHLGVNYKSDVYDAEEMAEIIFNSKYFKDKFLK